MNLELTEEQVEKIAIDWIKAQQQDESKAKDILDALFNGAHFAGWSWLDLITYTIRICSKQYAVPVRGIMELLK